MEKLWLDCCIPFGEHSIGSSAMICSAVAIRLFMSSLIFALFTLIAVTARPDDGMAGLRDGRCRTNTHRHTSSVANTTDFPGTMSPLSPPSPMTISGTGGGLASF